MDKRLKTFLENNKELIKENKWCELYDKAAGKHLGGMLANFLFDGLGQETMLDLFAEEGKIPNCAFMGCDSLTSITIPNSVTSIDDWAFSWCTSLPEITIPSSVTSIGDKAFYCCTCHIIFECDKNIVTEDVLYNFKGTYEFK